MSDKRVVIKVEVDGVLRVEMPLGVGFAAAMVRDEDKVRLLGNAIPADAITLSVDVIPGVIRLAEAARKEAAALKRLAREMIEADDYEAFDEEIDAYLDLLPEDS